MKKPIAKLQQIYSNVAFSDEKIADKALNGRHNGETMADIVNKIMHAENIEHETGKSGITDMKMNGQLVGWYDLKRGVGNIDQSAYDKIKIPAEMKDIYVFDTKDAAVKELKDSFVNSLSSMAENCDKEDVRSKLESKINEVNAGFYVPDDKLSIILDKNTQSEFEASKSKFETGLDTNMESIKDTSIDKSVTDNLIRDGLSQDIGKSNNDNLKVGTPDNHMDFDE